MFPEQSWGERRDSNPRSPGPQPGALTNLATLTTPQKSLAPAMKQGQREKLEWTHSANKLRPNYCSVLGSGEKVRESKRSSTIMSVFVWCLSGSCGSTL